MRAFDRNFARAVRIFDPNFMRGGQKPAHPRGKIPSGERLLRSDEILNGGGILSGLALNVGKILSGSRIFSSGEIRSDSKILNGGGILRDCEISSGSGILNETSRSRARRGFFRWILRELCGETSPLHLRRKFQSASGSQTDYKFKKAASLRVTYKFKTPMQKFHRGSCAAVELLRQKSRGETVPRNRLKFQSPPYVLARLKFQGAMSKMCAGSPSVPLKFQISVATLLRLKFEGAPNATPRLKFQSAMAVALARLKSGGSPRAAQCRKIRAQGQGG